MSNPTRPFTATLAASMLSNPAAVVAVIAPAVVNALVQGGRLPLASASLVGAAELAGMTVALLIGPSYVRTTRPRLLALGALVIAILGHLLSLQGDGVFWIATVRAIAGAAEGVAYAIAIAVLATMPVPERAFGIMITVNHVAATLLLALIAWIALQGARMGPVLIISVFLVITAPFALALVPARSGPAEAAEPRRMGVGPAACAIAGVFLLSSGFGMVWPLIGQIAGETGLTREATVSVLSLAGIGGIGGGMAAAAIAARFGRLNALVLASLAFALALAAPSFHAPLILVGFLILFLWTLNLPYYLGSAAAIDASGRLAVATSAMIPCGIACGQAMAGVMSSNWPLFTICFVGSGIILPAAAVMIVADRWHARATR